MRAPPPPSLAACLHVCLLLLLALSLDLWPVYFESVPPLAPGCHRSFRGVASAGMRRGMAVGQLPGAGGQTALGSAPGDSQVGWM